MQSGSFFQPLRNSIKPTLDCSWTFFLIDLVPIFIKFETRSIGHSTLLLWKTKYTFVMDRIKAALSVSVSWILNVLEFRISLVHNICFRSLVTTTDCVFLCWIQWYFWKFSKTIIKDLYTNKMIMPNEKRFNSFVPS